MYFIVTTREEHPQLDVANAIEIPIRDDDAENVRDIERFVERYVHSRGAAMGERMSAWGVGRSDFVSTIAELSEGNFMYVRYVLPDIEHGLLSAQTVGDIARLPRGLSAYYQRHWRQMKEQDEQRFTREQRPVLCFLAVGGEPVTVPQLAAWTHLDVTRTRRVVNEWRAFLNDVPGANETHYIIYHRSFADFLSQEEDLPIYHGRIAAAGWVALGVPGLG